MSQSSNRLVRWFGTRVALISRGGLAIATLLVALPLSGFLFLFFGYSFLSTNWLISLLLMLLVGTITHFVFLLILNFRFKNPSTNPAFLELIGRVHQKILVPSNAQVWIRHSNDAFITSTFNPVFVAVIVSEPMLELMLNRPEAGEVLLAFHLARIPRNRWFGDYVGSLVLLVILTNLSALSLVPLLISTISMIEYYGPLMIISLLSSLMPYFFIPFFLAFMIKGAFWRHEPVFLRVAEVYGMHPQVAKVEIERGSPLDEEQMQSVIWGLREWEKKRRGARRLGISIIATILIGLTLLLVTVSVNFPYSPYLFYVLIYIPFIAAFVIGVIIYFVIKRWDNNAMGDVFVETTDSHEPIWMD